MYQSLDDPIDMIAVFQNHALKPVRFRWNGNIHKIARVTGAWRSRTGESSIRHFAVVDTKANYYELTYNEHQTHWIISKIWVE